MGIIIYYIDRKINKKDKRESCGQEMIMIISACGPQTRCTGKDKEVFLDGSEDVVGETTEY